MAVPKRILVADECWVALARLHRAHPERASFTATEIADEVRTENAHGEIRPGINPHIYLHNVANRPPNSATYRMFVRLEDDTYRLFRPGDTCHPGRKGKTAPERRDLPPQYHELLDWYEKVYCGPGAGGAGEADPVLAMRGAGKEIWNGIDPDEYVATLRAGWQA